MSEKGRVIGTAGGALGLGGLAAAFGLCCTLPWAVALLGVTGAVAFARLAFLLPYALIGAAASRRALQWIVWIAAVVVAALSIVALTVQVTP
jgi:hypothetical protein